MNMERFYNETMSVMPELKMSKQDYYRYYSYASSRCLILKINGKRQHAIIPVFDMMNAYPRSKPELESVTVRLHYIVKIPYLQVRTTREVKAGEEILYLYSRTHTNTDYLINYGFVFADSDDVTLQFVFGYGDNAKIKREILRNFPYVAVWENVAFVSVKNSSNEEDYQILYSAIRIIESNDIKKLMEIKKELNEKKVRQISPISNEEEKRAMTRVMKVSMNKLKAHPTTLEEDERIIGNLPLFTTQRNLVQLRRDEKLALIKIIKYTQTRLAKSDLT